jgi:hypothetical protein
MKISILAFAMLFFVGTAHAQLPFNPDSDANGVINVNDLLELLTVYGQPYLVEAVVPINAGGTDANNPIDARANLGLAIFKDSLWTINDIPTQTAWIDAVLVGTNSSALGFECEAIGDYSHSQGYSTSATGDFSHAENRFSSATGICSHAEGEGSLATGTASHSEGYQSETSGTAGHAEGYQTAASGAYSHSQNRFSVASGTCAHAEGESCFAIGTASHAEGLQTTASGLRSHSAGLGTIADQNNQTVVGAFNTTNNVTSLFVVGNGSDFAQRSDAFVVLDNGNAIVSGDLDVQGIVLLNGVDLSLQLQELQVANTLLQQQVIQLQEQLVNLLNAPSEE